MYTKRVASVDELTKRVWDDAMPGNARATIQTDVRRLRGLLSDGLIQTRPPGYLVAVAAKQLDLKRLRIW